MTTNHKVMKSDTAWKIVMFTVAVSILGCFSALFILQVNQLHAMQSSISQLENHLQQLQSSYLGHVSQQEDFQRAMKAAAGKSGYWWAYVQMNKAHARVYSGGRTASETQP